MKNRQIIYVCHLSYLVFYICDSLRLFKNHLRISKVETIDDDAYILVCKQINLYIIYMYLASMLTGVDT